MNLSIIATVITIIVIFFSGCFSSNNILSSKLIKDRDSDDINISQMKEQLKIENDHLKRKSDNKGEYLLRIETKKQFKKLEPKKGVRSKGKNDKTSGKTMNSNSKDRVIKSMLITDGKQDVPGGKMICSRETILYRISRSRLIQCIHKYKSNDFVFWFQNYAMMNLEELSSIKHGKITHKCNKQNIGAYIDRTLLKSCLQQSLNEGRYIYRNPSSIMIKINFKEAK